jgi:hypothetical protein
MLRDNLFGQKQARLEHFDFGKETAAVFDDMLILRARSQMFSPEKRVQKRRPWRRTLHFPYWPSCHACLSLGQAIDLRRQLGCMQNTF